MHVTTAEAALAGVLISAAIGWVASVTAQRATRARDHYVRIWDRQVELYEAVHIECSKAYKDCGHYTSNLEDWSKAGDIKEHSHHMEGVDLETLTARLTLFGSYQVANAFMRFLQTVVAWQDTWHKMSDTHRSSTSNSVERFEACELVRAQYKAVTGAYGFLANLLALAVQEVPNGLPPWPQHKRVKAMLRRMLRSTRKS